MQLNEQRILKLAGLLKEDVQLNELEFGTQKEFDSYQKKHNLRPTTKVKVAGKTTTAGAAAKQSVSKGTSVFGKNTDSPQNKMVMKSKVASDGNNYKNIDTEVNIDYYRMKSDNKDLSMSRKQSKLLAKALGSSDTQKIEADTNKAGDKFDTIIVKPNSNGFNIKVGNKEINISKNQSKQLRKDIRDSF